MTVRYGAAALVLSLLALPWSHPSQAALFTGPSQLNPAFCREKTFRQTIIYIDEAMMRQGHTSWAIDLNTRLDASLLPGERVTVVRLSSLSGTSHEIWSGCWPGYTAAQREAIEKKSYFFSSNPLRDLKSQKSYFTLDLGAALTQIYSSAIHGSSERQGAPQDLSQKNIVVALASDAARFSQSSNTIRAIVYADLTQSSKLAAALAPAAGISPNYGQKFGVYFPRSVFYLYGVGPNGSDTNDFLARARTFWEGVLSSMNATVEAVGSDLVISNRIPTKHYDYRISLDRNGQKLFGRMSLSIDNDGHLIDSWIGISRLSYVALQGTFNCQGKAASCVLNASTDGSLTTSSNEEIVQMTGQDSAALSGTVGVQGALTFNMSANQPNN